MASAFFSATSVPAVRQFDYDDANRMHAVRHDGVVAMRYLYNAMGERVHRAGSGIAVATLYDEDGKWIGDYDANGQPIQQVVWLDDLPVGLLVGAGANQKLYYIEADALGSPRVVIDPVRNVAVWNWNLADEAFGDSAPNQDVDGDGTAFVFDMRFPGQRYDSATGLNYNYFRDYDPGTGRYAQSDPIGLDGGMSTYGYANGSPLVYSDPEGMFAALVLRFAMRYALPQAGLRLGATHAVKRVTPRLMRGDIKRVVWRPVVQQPKVCPPVSASGKAAKMPLWSSTKSKSSVDNAFGHWKQHGSEFPEFQNSKQYVDGAKSLFNSPPAGTLTKARPNGDKLFYNPANNTFGVQAANGAPRTMFRPTDRINYWNKQ